MWSKNLRLLLFGFAVPIERNPFSGLLIPIKKPHFGGVAFICTLDIDKLSSVIGF